MTKQKGTKSFPSPWNKAAKTCDFCNSLAATLFCRTHAAFMCMACDARLHDNARDKHARVWICEVCEQAPSIVTCKADAAALCVTCDRDIHSANPLASRHERVPVVPFHDNAESVVIKSSGIDSMEKFSSPPITREMKQETCVATDDYMTDSWIFNNPTVPLEMKCIDFLLSDSDQFLEFDNYGMNPLQPYSDSVVPVQTINETPVSGQFTNDYSSENRFEIDFTRANISSYNTYTPPSLSVSSSSIDVGVVPDNSAFSDTSYPFGKNPNPIVDPGHGLGMDREARVLRYREKRKNRKFEKTVRYASRKAYAETRPRIKGRFAKKTDTESDIERIFSGPCNFQVAETYSVVPSF